MTKEEMEIKMEATFKHLAEQCQEALASGSEHAKHFFHSTAYVLGTLVPMSAKPEHIGGLTASLVEALTDGVQAGFEAAELPGEFTILKMGMPHEKR